jgi:tetratricopeptide (TPR) repeat protein
MSETTNAKRFEAAGGVLRLGISAAGITIQRAAVRLSLPLPTLKSYLSGQSAPRPSDPLFDLLGGVIGRETASRYRDAVCLARERVGQTSTVDSRIDALISKGRLGEALNSLRTSAEHLDPGRQAQLYLRLGRAQFDIRQPDLGIDSYRQAISLKAAQSPAESPDALVDELAGRLTFLDSFDEAAEAVVSQLSRNIQSGLLWRRLGIIRWHEDKNADAYAALTTAQVMGLPENRLVHTRGQVLLELGVYDLARVDLEKAIVVTPSDISKAYARNALARTLFCLGEQDRAMEEFRIAEDVIPESAWLRFRRAQCYLESGETELAVTELHNSLRFAVPPLNPAKRCVALKLLAEHSA